MSDQQNGKKEFERIMLYPFLEAYEWVTGESLTLIFCDESPDFICKRQNGKEVGIELSRVTREPEDIFFERILNHKEEMDIYTAQEFMHYLIEKKEKAREKSYTTKVLENILVLQLVDNSLKTLQAGMEGLQADFVNHGFEEIWLADYSGLEAYGDIELFGLYPEKWWGYHVRPWLDRKPYG
jgi:hypothetical protein